MHDRRDWASSRNAQYHDRGMLTMTHHVGHCSLCDSRDEDVPRDVGAQCLLSRDVRAQCRLSRDLRAQCLLSHGVRAQCLLSHDVGAQCLLRWPNVRNAWRQYVIIVILNNAIICDDP